MTTLSHQTTQPTHSRYPKALGCRLTLYHTHSSRAYVSRLLLASACPDCPVTYATGYTDPCIAGRGPHYPRAPGTQYSLFLPSFPSGYWSVRHGGPRNQVTSSHVPPHLLVVGLTVRQLDPVSSSSFVCNVPPLYCPEVRFFFGGPIPQEPLETRVCALRASFRIAPSLSHPRNACLL